MKEENEIVKTNLEGLDFDYTVYLHIKKGFYPKQIADKYKMSKQRIDYYIQRLKRNGYIQKVGKGAWNVLKDYSQNEPREAQLNLGKFLTMPKTFRRGLVSDSVRGHAFAFVLKIPRIRNWDRRVEWLKREKVSFGRVGFGGSGQSFKFKNFKVWLCNKSVVVYFPRWKQYFTDAAKDSKDYAVYDFLELVKALERFLGCSFKIMNEYQFRVSKQHYALVKNSLAQQYNRSKKKLYVYDGGGLWLLIDDSFKELGLGDETEGVHKDTAVSDTTKVQDFFNSLKENPFTSKDILELRSNEKEVFARIKGLSENLANISVLLSQSNDVIEKLVLQGNPGGKGE